MRHLRPCSNPRLWVLVERWPRWHDHKQRRRRPCQRDPHAQVNVLLYEADDESHDLETVNVCLGAEIKNKLTDVTTSMTVDIRSATR